MRTFNEILLRDRLQQLPQICRIAFAACCATRLYPTYSRRQDAPPLGSPDVVRSALTSVWAATDEHHRTEGAVVDGHLECIMALLPSEDDPCPGPKFSAEDFLASVAYALRTCKSDNAETAAKEAAWAARRVFEAISSYLIENRSIDINRQGFAELIDHEPEMQNELARQNRDLEELEALASTKPSSSWRVGFRQRAENESALHP